MGGQSTSDIAPKSYADWVSATVTTADVTVGRSGWADSPLTPYARRFRQYAIICASLNASNVAAVPLRLYSKGAPKRKRAKTATVPKCRRRWLTSKGVGAKASGYAAYADDTVQEVIDHPAMALVRKPNPWMAGSFFVEWIDSSMEVTGNAFIYATNDRGRGTPTMLLPLMPHYTKIIPSESGLVAGYYYGRDKYEIARLEPEEVCHFKFRPNPLDPYYGLAPIAAALVESDLAHQATVSEWHRWENGGRPDFAVKIDTAATSEQKKQIRSEIEAYTRGTAKCGNFLLLTGSEVVPLGFAPKEMEYLAGLSRSDEMIWNAFGVPQSLVKLNDANLASSETGHVQYHKLTINPRCARIAETLTDFILPIFGVEPGDMWFAFDDASEEAENDESGRLVSLTSAGIMTIDEARACEGLEPLENGLGAIPRVNGQPLSDPTKSSPDPLAGMGDGDTEDDEASDKEGDDIGDAIDVEATDESEDGNTKCVCANCNVDTLANSDSHSLSIPHGLKFYGERAIITKDKQTPLHSEAGIDALARKFYDDLVAYYTGQSKRILDDGPMAQASPRDGDLMGIIERNLMDLHNSGVLAGYAKQGYEIAEGNLPKLTVAQAERYVGAYVPKLAMSISDDLTMSLRGAIIQGMADGRTYQDVAAEIQTIIPDMADWRAERVARTETSTAIGNGEIAAWEQLGIDGKEWLLGGNSCEFCEAIAAANPDPIPINQPFAKVGQTYAGVTITWADVMAGGTAHPNCTCSQAAVLLDEDEPTND